MAVEHEILNSRGKLENVRLTPVRAIRKHCLECLGYSSEAVKDCTSPNCALYPYRLGHKPK